MAQWAGLRLRGCAWPRAALQGPLALELTAAAARLTFRRCVEVLCSSQGRPVDVSWRDLVLPLLPAAPWRRAADDMHVAHPPYSNPQNPTAAKPAVYQIVDAVASTPPATAAAGAGCPQARPAAAFCCGCGCCRRLRRASSRRRSSSSGCQDRSRFLLAARCLGAPTEERAMPGAGGVWPPPGCSAAGCARRAPRRAAAVAAAKARLLPHPRCALPAARLWCSCCCLPPANSARAQREWLRLAG
jgi:hypothetical protein